jgi:hypothetical protein
MDIEDGFKITVPHEDMDKLYPLGAYTIIVLKTGEVVIQGLSVFSINNAKIGTVGVLPIDQDIISTIEDYPFENNLDIVYRVDFSKRAWYFKNKSTAFSLMNTILEVKEIALWQKRNKIKFEEDKK